MKKEKSYLQSESRSLGIECKGINEFSDKEELEALATAIKEVYFQDYKTVYDNGDNSQRQIIKEKSQFMIWGTRVSQIVYLSRSNLS
jgi:hypothetical protein